ncbi:hypothetical protein B0T13DRAFT_467513 [Neurospora crassa]|nr:hypothetical protein B0T13DRAFT_467513 [Neurospora crassa]
MQAGSQVKRVKSLESIEWLTEWGVNPRTLNDNGHERKYTRRIRKLKSTFRRNFVQDFERYGRKPNSCCPGTSWVD